MSDVTTKKLAYYSNQSSPNDQIEVEFFIPALFIDKVKSVVNSLKELGANEIVFWNPFDYKFFTNQTNESDEFEYSIELCEAKIDHSGCIGFVFHFKNIDDEYGWTDEFNLAEFSAESKSL